MSKLKIAHPVFAHPRLVTYGTGSIRALARSLDLSRTAFFLSGQQSVCDTVSAALNKAGVDAGTLTAIIKDWGEPSEEMLRRGADFLSQKRLSRIVAIGGGSVLDWCRLSWAVSRGLLRLGDSRLHQEATVEEHPEFWLIPSTCGTGAEAATVAVYNSENGAKVPVVSQAFLASHVILDGQFLTSVRSGSLECSLSDALSHAIESFVSIVPCGIAKESAVSALWLILENYELPVSTSRNDKLMEAGFLGGLSASHCSVGVVHAFAHTVARDGIAHGHGNALGLIPGILTNAETPAMQLLLKRCALPSVRDLLQRVRPIVEKAIAARPTEHLMRQLRDSAGRAALRDRMTKDVCMRSNPRPLAAGDIDQFLDRVLEIAGSI